jgi:drug/metabolite transporter (DMT)-like permease
MRMTSVATGTALTATQPIFAALFIKVSGGHIPRRAWSGMFIAFASVLLITGVDLSMSLRSFQGDLLAVIGGALAALYIIIGSNVQREISTSTFTTVCYLSCALTALPVAVIGGYDLIGFSNYEWILLIALVLTAQIMGHTMFNLTLKRVSPAIVGLVVFFEVPVSAILAFFWLDQTPPAGTIPGIIGLLIGCGFFVVRSKQ